MIKALLLSLPLLFACAGQGQQASDLGPIDQDSGSTPVDGAVSLDVGQPPADSTPDKGPATDLSQDGIVTDAHDSSSVDTQADFSDPKICPNASSESPGFAVQPFLQAATPSSIWIVWETDSGLESRIDWGTSQDLNRTVCGDSIEGSAGSRIHEAQLTGLEPETRYHYRVQTGLSQSAVFDFITPPLAESERSFRMVAISDMQIDVFQSQKYSEIVQDGIIDYVTQTFGPDLPTELQLALVPGDLVDNGLFYFEWAAHFFGPGEDLMSHVPFYPIPGNHENDSEHFFKYFHLPENGTNGYLEHWWHFDYSNVRFIGLDSNSGYRIQEQLDWLAQILDATCDDPNIDFVFAELHHPHKSELWIDGEIDFTGDVIGLLETFSSDCNKASIHFFGHTHGYSRGQSRDHQHLWVNVASAGGNLDYWGEYDQRDYDEFTVSLDEYGFVMVEVEAGDDPSFLLSRIGRGTPGEPMNNELRDSILIRKNNTAPVTPMALSPSGTLGCSFALALEASEFIDADGDLHGASHWQVSEDCLSFSSLAFEQWRQHQNWYYDVDTQANDLLTDEVVTGLESGKEYCWRVRYRDQSLAWSAWSEPLAFSLEATDKSANLLINPGAEDGTTGWTTVTGYFESLSDGECGGIAPYAGDQYFAVGGLCDTENYSEVYQRVEMPSDVLSNIQSGDAVAVYGGFVSTWSGSDEPAFKLIFYDENLDVITETATTSSLLDAWTESMQSAPIPAQTTIIDMVLMGTKKAGFDNDCYFDDLLLSVQHCDAPSN